MTTTPRVTERFMHAVLSITDLEQTVAGYVSLNRNFGDEGTDVILTGTCPFHINDRTHTLYVSKSRRRWRCDGCRAEGNAIGFVMQIEHLTFQDAVLLLGDRVGIQPTTRQSRSGDNLSTEFLNHSAPK